MPFNVVPTNYQPIPKAARRRGPPPGEVGHDRRRTDRFSGVFTLKLTAIDPVRVGSGVHVVGRENGNPYLAHDVTFLHPPAGRPILPGSSLKGTIRSLVEALGGGCDVPGSCGNDTCIACSLFGFVAGERAWAARVGFEDAQPLGDGPFLVPMDLPRAFPPKRDVGRRAYGPPPSGMRAEVPHRVYPAGRAFGTRMTVENLSEQELGLLFLALGMGRQFAPRVGGGKFFGLGRVKVEVLAAWLRGAGPRPVRLDSAAATARVRHWLAQAPSGDDVNRVLAVLGTQMRSP